MLGSLLAPTVFQCMDSLGCDPKMTPLSIDDCFLVAFFYLLHSLPPGHPDPAEACPDSSPDYVHSCVSERSRACRSLRQTPPHLKSFDPRPQMLSLDLLHGCQPLALSHIRLLTPRSYTFWGTSLKFFSPFGDRVRVILCHWISPLLSVLRSFLNFSLPGSSLLLGPIKFPFFRAILCLLARNNCI